MMNKKSLNSLVLSLITLSAQAQPFAELEKSALKIIQQKCVRCHSATGEASYVFESALDIANLIKKNQIIPKDPSHSPFLTSITSGRMPKGSPQLSTQDQEILTKWIAQMELPKGSNVPCISESSLLQTALNDAKNNVSVSERPFIRYISLANTDDPNSTARAVTKALNSVSTAKEMYKPDIIGGTLMRIDISKLGMSAATWDLIQNSNPAKKTRATNFFAGDFQKELGTSFPFINADILVSSVIRPPLYNQLLNIPNNVSQLETSLGINVQQNILDKKVSRSGFRHSGVSINNRIIERHETNNGYYWKSYDFSNNLSTQNIFSNPEKFKSAGGEIIYSLPNGMQAYMLTDGQGNRIDKAPVSIVSDAKRPDHAVENGISCFRCHSSGILDKKDEVFSIADANSTDLDLLERLRSLYIDPNEMSQKVKADNLRHQNALKKVGINPNVDDVSRLIEKFEGDLDLKKAACELDITTRELLELISKGGDKLVGFAPLNAACTIPRETYLAGFKDIDQAKKFLGEKSRDGFSVGDLVIVPNSNGRTGFIINHIDNDGIFHLTSLQGNIEILKPSSELRPTLKTQKNYGVGEVMSFNDSLFKITQIDNDGSVHAIQEGTEKESILNPATNFLKLVPAFNGITVSKNSVVDSTQGTQAVPLEVIAIDEKGKVFVKNEAGQIKSVFANTLAVLVDSKDGFKVGDVVERKIDENNKDDVKIVSIRDSGDAVVKAGNADVIVKLNALSVKPVPKKTLAKPSSPATAKKLPLSIPPKKTGQ